MTMWPQPDDDDPYAGPSRPSRDDLDIQLAGHVVRQLRATGLLDEEMITVEVRGGVVILAGIVSSSTDKRAAATAAGATPGIRDVNNGLSVAPVGEGNTDDGADPFDQIVSRFHASSSIGNRPASVSVRRWLAGLLLVGFSFWSLAAALGWIGVIVWCLCAAVLLEAVLVVSDRRLRGPPR